MNIVQEMPVSNLAEKFTDIDADWNPGQSSAGRSKTFSARPIWPEYFARLGQEDATTWHYQGYMADTIRVWRAFYGLMIFHPCVSFIGMRQFFHSLVYRIFGEKVGKILSPLTALLTPIFMVFTPVLSLIAVAVAPPFLRIFVDELPSLFTPFKFMGWSNYNIMLATVFTLHGYKQAKSGLHPAIALKHSSKMFWNEFFHAHLPEGHRPTKVFATLSAGRIRGEIPRANLIIKPTAAGAGHKLRSMIWDRDKEVYVCNDPERLPTERHTYTPDQLVIHLKEAYTEALVERMEVVRVPLPVSSIRVLTINISGQSEFLCGAFLPAPEGSCSTAYFDLDTYLFNYDDSSVGIPIRANSDGRFQGLPIPELGEIIEACLAMHDHLPGHIEISWDVLLTEDGPVYLEGNVFPPGCDYKLSIFKTNEKWSYMKKRIIGLS